MNDAIECLADGTLVFLPERLNRDPAVLRGLTNDEMWLALGTGALLGLLLGVPWRSPRPRLPWRRPA